MTAFLRTTRVFTSEPLIPGVSTLSGHRALAERHHQQPTGTGRGVHGLKNERTAGGV
jgi:hypothetical protein